MQNMKTANIFGIFVTPRLVMFSRLVTHFRRKHSMSIFTRGDSIFDIFLNSLKTILPMLSEVV